MDRDVFFGFPQVLLEANVAESVRVQCPEIPTRVRHLLQRVKTSEKLPHDTLHPLLSLFQVLAFLSFGSFSIWLLDTYSKAILQRWSDLKRMCGLSYRYAEPVTALKGLRGFHCGEHEVEKMWGPQESRVDNRSDFLPFSIIASTH